MNTVLFSTLKGAPIAFLLLSQPEQRECVFVVAAQDVATYESPEGRALLPDRPTEYSCTVRAGASGTIIEFKNQIGWSLHVRLDEHDDGEWVASKDNEHLSGVATGN